jgi:hypothetical protein
MQRILLALVATLALGVTACAAWVDADGFQVRYVDPVVTTGHRHYVHRGVDVWEVNGHYYRQHAGRWAEYRTRPGDLVER